ncbi:primosomal protein N' [Nocardioides sp. zg-1228]|uniref:primosomal protein N' n=1 Tax=Nocardioides sp. zg-1228 TaxID=2763008 RepID=UPI001642AB81|nr:primosomal protein N' [Nocardioides sp. zg-1228]MBC2934551.1 primosomal protein N' [Nocardioides sp. zg-1228]QSF59306.1 primosomal protein N' [Nocardioides sp. zg-1228]
MTSREAPEADMLPGLRAAVDDARAKAAATRRRKAAAWEPAAVDPVARVLVDIALAHLDRPFDYAVPIAMAETAVPGARVKVRFAGQDVDGYVVERASRTDHTGILQPLRRVVSPEPVLAPEIAELSATIAHRYAGARSDVLRLAVPPRHAATEKLPSPPAPPAPSPPVPAAWAEVPHADAFLSHVATGGAPRAVWSAAPGDDWPAMIAEAVAATYAAGRGALVCVPDRRDVARVDAALTELLGEGHHVCLSADGGPAARYRDFLAVSRGARRVVVGTRSAAFAPVHDLGLVALWDDGDDLHAEPRAPYPHTREVLLLRAEQQGTAALLGGVARTPEAQQLVASGWAHELAVPREVLRRRVRVEAVPAEDRSVGTRIPRAAYDAIRQGLTAGPVLVQTPRAGYAASLACDTCRTPARCTACTGPLVVDGPVVPPRCRWCGHVEAPWSCPTCGGHGLRAPVRGGARTAEELGRMFPGTTVRTSSGERVVDRVDAAADLVVATVGAEPVAEGGYAAVVVLDTWLSLARDDMRAAEEALRRWLNAAALARVGGHVVAVGDPAHPALQALVRWDPAGFARREAEERSQAHLPPAARLATVTGDLGALDDVLHLLDLPDGAEVLGPVPVDDEHRVLVRVPRGSGEALSRSLGDLQRIRSARKLDPVRVQVDPLTV